MRIDGLLIPLLELMNEILAAAIVVVATSMLLYNLSRNMKDRVARTSGIVLSCVTMAYVCDVLISLDPGIGSWAIVLKLQWIGIAFIPAAMFHLSDALLATTGLMSRGRRRRVIRILYLISSSFLVLATFSDQLVYSIVDSGTVTLRAGPVFLLYLVYFVLAVGIAFVNVQRARQRCLTRDTRRRMGYLQFAFLTPAFGIFPFSVLLGETEQLSLPVLTLVNSANLIIILMLLFLAYPLSFFGSRIPDRVVKAELLRFMLRGPATGLLALVVILSTNQATRVLGIDGEDFMPFAVVAIVLLWQWVIAMAIPWLEKRLIYNGEDREQMVKLQNLSERLLTHTDLMQLLEAILAASCDYLRVNTTFVALFKDNALGLIQTVGPARPTETWLSEESQFLFNLLDMPPDDSHLPIHTWHSYWIVPVFSRRSRYQAMERSLIGVFGVSARAPEVDFNSEEWQMFRTYIRRAARTLDDLALQEEIYGALQGLLPQITMTRTRAAEVEYRPGRAPAIQVSDGFDREELNEHVKAALRHYWGGPGLTSNRLFELQVVQNALVENEDNPTRALRSVLQKAIECQRPMGERKLSAPEWTIYNILEMRFVERKKVRDVAYNLTLSEPDLYRKQRVAIEAVTDTLIEMEQSALNT